MSRFRQFGAISKTEELDDGTIKVWGIASSESKDHVGETILASAMKSALPDYTRFPALREMHAPSAAGKVIEAEVDGDGITQICAHVVDPLAITKVKTGVYAGFSIGGKVLKRDPNDRSVITALRLVEISLVDSPCNPDATLNMWKAEMSDYTPKSDDVVAKAKELAKAQGHNRFKDFLYKAREALMEEAAAAEAADDEVEKADEAHAEIVAVADENVEAVVEPAEEVVENADAEKVDPADALKAAIVSAEDAIAEASAVAAPVDTGELEKALDVVIAGLPGAEEVLVPLAKGLYSVSYLADVLGSLRSLLNQVTNYGEGGNAGSQVPAEIATAIRDLGGTLVTLAQEEVAVLLTSAGSLLPEIEIVELAALVEMTKGNEAVMAKAGARNSKADATHIQKAHDHMTALGATCASGNCGDDADKVAGLEAENERLSKALTEAAPAIDELTKRFSGQIEALTKRLEQVESEPAAPKTAAGSLRAVTKTEDVSPTTAAATSGVMVSGEDFQKSLDALPEKYRGEILLRVALANPHLVQTARAAA